jgi:hypothetical protein
MAEAVIQFTLDGGEHEGALMRFEPRSRMSGAVTVTPGKDIRAKRVYAQLQWHTEGRGDRDEGVVAAVAFENAQLRANMPMVGRFTFDLPDSPWSFAGHYINIVWEVMLIVDIPLAADLRASQPFILAPRRP